MPGKPLDLGVAMETIISSLSDFVRFIGEF